MPYVFSILFLKEFISSILIDIFLNLFLPVPIVSQNVIDKSVHKDNIKKQWLYWHELLVTLILRDFVCYNTRILITINYPSPSNKDLIFINMDVCVLHSSKTNNLSVKLQTFS